MTIYLGSRYQSTPVRAEVDRQGIQRLFVLRVQQPADDASLPTYIWREGDRIDRVALALLGQASRWHQIMDVNPDLLDPGSITPGTVVRYPSA